MRGFEKTLSRIVKIILWIIPILPLYVSTGLLFPFITGKNFIFRILVEVALALWVGLIVSNKEYLPRLTSLFKSATVFILVLFLADLLSPNPYRAFFSNYERMEGFMMLFHLYLYFVLLLSMFKSKKDWLIFFHFSIVTSLLVSFIGLMQKFGLRVSLQGGYRVDSTIGNPAYLAAYLSFHIWLMFILLKSFWHKIGLRFIYIVSIIFELIIIYLTATRGAAIALLVGFFLLVLACTVFWKKIFTDARTEKYHRWAVAVLVALVVVPSMLWIMRGTRFVRSNQVLNRLVSISLSEGTVKSRLNIWSMSFRGVLERPVFGWGQENYYLVFQKYFNPKLYAQEPWFDRSHNIIFDWLVHAGFLGLFSFLAMLFLAGKKLISSVRSSAVSFWEGMVLLVAFVSYLIQNLFVFDNLNTYLLFFGFLAYSDFLGKSQDVGKDYRQHFYSGSQKGIYAAGISLVAVFLLIYFFHMKAMEQSHALIRALQLNSIGSDGEATIQAFKKALSYDAFGKTEVREQLGNSVRDAFNSNRYNPEIREKMLVFASDELKKEISRPAKDIKHMIFMASILGRGGPTRAAEAEQILKEAISLSPNKQILYFELAQIYINQNRIDEAIGVLRKSLYLESSYQQAVVNLFILGQLTNRDEVVLEAEKYIKLTELNEDMLKRVGSVYQQRKDWPKALEVYKKLVEDNPTNVQYLAIAAALSAELNYINQAVRYAEEASRLNPEYAKEAKIFLDQIRQKQK